MDVSGVIRPRSPPSTSKAGPHDTVDPGQQNELDHGPVPVPSSDPASSTLSALARFEFQAGKGNEGTKILMVEWAPTSSLENNSPSSSVLSAVSRPWQVSWEGKTNNLLVSDKDTGGQKRVYFLLPPGAAVPPVIAITAPDGSVLTTKPLPAIFPPGLVASHSDAGTRGVLHTIWAKKRLSELQEEIDAEMKTNSESVGLEMVLQERQWIADHFGVVPVQTSTSASTSQVLPSPVSPKSPASGRLGEKLKGLKLATSAADLVAGSAGKDAHLRPISFSPASSDMAVSSFSNFVRMAPPKPNAEVPVSLDAVLNNSNSLKSQDHDQEDELFALPMSPRSPEMARSPFSLG